MERRILLSSDDEQFVISTPLTITLPDFGRSSPMICRNSVLFPEPLPPNRTMVSPASMSRLSLFKTRRPSYSTTKSRTEMTGISALP